MLSSHQGWKLHPSVYSFHDLLFVGLKRRIKDMNPKPQQICTAQCSAHFCHGPGSLLALHCCLHLYCISKKWCHCRVLIHIAKPIAQLQEWKVLLHPSYSLKSNSTRQLEYGGLCVFSGSFWVFYWNEGGSIAMCTGESPRNLSHLCVSIFKLNDVKMLIWACRTSEFSLVSFTEKFDFCMYVIWEAQFCTQHHEIFSKKYSV